MTATALSHAREQDDLEIRVEQVIEEVAVICLKLAADPASRDALALAALNGARLEDVRRELADYRATKEALELAVQSGRERERASGPRRRRDRAEVTVLRAVRG